MREFMADLSPIFRQLINLMQNQSRQLRERDQLVGRGERKEKERNNMKIKRKKDKVVPEI